jgi:uncharacterized protein YlzI (FlbEa/FlbD family)
MPRLVRVDKYLLNPDAIDYAEATHTTLSGNNLATKIYLRSGRELLVGESPDRVNQRLGLADNSEA